MKNKNIQVNLIYVGLIIFIWLAAYIFCQIIWKQELGWDEIAYMSVAKGIANDFDFSSRAYTVMGLIKHGYPSNLINFPVFSVFLSIFFKLFGASQQVAYFSTWLSALGVCIAIYFIFLMLSDNDHKTSFITSISYLFFPGILRNCDTAMMEQTACLLLCSGVFFILRDYVSEKFNYFTALKLAFFFLLLWLYKSLFLGILFGVLVFIFLARNSKVSLPIFLILSYGLFVILFYVLKSFVFLPVAPMLTFTPELEYSQVYATFSEALLRNFPQNIFSNISFILSVIVGSYFVYPNIYSPQAASILPFTSYMVYVGLYFFLFLTMIVLTFSSWKKLNQVSRLFLVFTIVSIITFNLVFNFLFITTLENIFRYNVYYLPLYLCSLALVLRANAEYLKPFSSAHPRVTESLFALIIIFIYIPVFLSMIDIQSRFWTSYYNRAKINTEIVKSALQGNKPQFIYFNDGAHVTWELYPIKQIIKDATNEQLLQINKILPVPVELLFLRPTDWLFKNNQEQILKGEPILNGVYKLLGVNNNAQVVVYKLNK